MVSMPKLFQAVYIDVLNVLGRGFHDDLELVIVLEAVGVLPVAPVRGRRDGWMHGVLWFRSETAKECGGMNGLAPTPMSYGCWTMQPLSAQNFCNANMRS